MALTYTPTDHQALTLPDFTLPAVDGKTFSSKTIHSAPAKVIAFICNHCPYVKAIESRLVTLAQDLEKIKVPFIGICSNDASEYPEDSPNELLKRWQEVPLKFTYLVDESQKVAKSFGAVCTPDFFVFDKNNKLIYRGRLDDSWKDEGKVTKRELFAAVQSILKTQPLTLPEIPSMGCSIKWKGGAE